MDTDQSEHQFPVRIGDDALGGARKLLASRPAAPVVDSVVVGLEPVAEAPQHGVRSPEMDEAIRAAAYSKREQDRRERLAVDGVRQHPAN